MKKLLTIFLSIFSVSTFGQSGQWTWMKGDSLPTQPAHYGTQGVASSTNKPGYTYEGTEWKDLSGNFWMYDNFDLWKFNPSTLEWTWIKGTHGVYSNPNYGTKGIPSITNHPGFRYHCAASWTDNYGDFWLFGSQGISGFKNDLWKYNIASNEWTWINGDSTFNLAPIFGTKGISSATTKPGGIYETNASWTDRNNNLWLFGGWGYNFAFAYGEWNTLWKYDPNINQWTWMSGDSIINAPAVYGTKGIANTNNKPSARFAYSKWIVNDDLWLFGGATSGGNNKLNDLWKYNIITNQWTWVSGTDTFNDPGVYLEKCVPCSECYPASRNESRSSWRDFNGNLWLYGGQPGNGAGGFGSWGDLWVYNPTTNKWTWVFGSSIPTQTLPVYGTLQVASPTNNPGGKNGCLSWIDGFGNLWLFAGQNGPPFNDLWKYNIDSISCNGIESGINEINSSSSVIVFPNPFSESTSIQISVTNNSKVSVHVFNLQGQIIATLLNVQKSNGDYKIDFAPATYHLIEGIYIIEVRINNETVTRKIVKVN